MNSTIVSASAAQGSVGTASVGTASVGTASVATASVCTASVGTASVGTASVGAASVCTACVGTASVGTAESDVCGPRDPTMTAQSSGVAQDPNNAMKTQWKFRHVIDRVLFCANKLLGNRVSSVGDTRTIFVGVRDVVPDAEQQKFTDNRIKTSKYTLWNFVPKNLFEQFRRIANFYFLIMTIVALSIDSPISPLTSLMPLTFVIVVTAVKQAYEDYLRYHADKEINCLPVTVIRNGVLQELKAQQVKVGDVVKVVSDTEIPCDLVLLSTSDTSGKCYITTANLDGETNLKTLFCPRMLRFVGVNGQLGHLKARIECEQPTPNLYHFFGKIRLLSSSDLDLAISSTTSPASLPLNGLPPSTGNVTRASTMRTNNNTRMSFRRLRAHNRSVSFTAQTPVSGEEEVGSGSIGARVSVLSNFSERGVDTLYDSPSDSISSGQQSSNFRRNVSRRESKRSDVRRTVRPSFIAKEEEDEAPLEDIRRASEMGLGAPLSTENLMLRGHRLKNTEYIYGCAVYTGQETKLALNSKLTSNKFSSLERSINKYLLFFMGVLVFEVVLCTSLKYIIEAQFDPSVFLIIGELPVVTARLVINDLLSFFILFNYIIPISLYVTIEMQKFLGTLFFEWDIDMYDPKVDGPAVCNTSDLNEELGQIQYLFTDKTGTLTENTMWFRRCSIDGVSYLEDEGKLYIMPPSGDDKDKVLCEIYPPNVEQFLLAMAVCHSVQVNASNSANNNSVDLEATTLLDYQASSPDEKALVEASARMGVVFMGEKDDEIYVRQHGRLRRFNTLNCLEFTSDRKRMSVIVEDEEHGVWLYCKGAESHVIPLVTGDNAEETLEAVGEFAMRGLRAMVIGYRQLGKLEYAALSHAVDAARQNLTGERESLIAACYNDLEMGLTLLGATGVEDQLQDGVQETLESLKAAGIKIWILTGDKVETAVNISFSCGHFKNGTVLLYLTEKKKEEDCKQEIINLRQRVHDEHLEQFGLIVDGISLAHALKDTAQFVELCQLSAAVICCRMSPLQKCEVVQMMKNSPSRPITAAIGDGANDVSMIQEAHVGIGLMGKEGRQAVRCSDFAFSRFRFLRKTLLVHGNWFYLRIATLVQYFFYKNIVFITPQLYYAFHNAFSTQPLYDTWYLTLFNVIFTSLPILIYGLFEQNYSATTLLNSPHLYREISGDALMTWKCFFKWNALGLWHSVIIYFLPYSMLRYNDIDLYDMTPLDFWCYGTLMFHVVICVTNIKLMFYSRYWTWMFLGSIFLSIASVILFSAFYSGVWLESFSSMYWVYIQLCSSLTFWLSTFLLTLVCVIPDCLMPVLAPHWHDCTSRLGAAYARRWGNRRGSDYSGTSWFNKNAGSLNITATTQLEGRSSYVEQQNS